MKQKKETAREQDRQKQNKKMEKKFQTKEISFSETSDIRAFHLSAASVYFYDHTDQWSFSGEILCIKKSGSAGRSKKCSFSDESG